jgi:hypothetical protein
MNRGMALFATALMIFLCFILYTRWYPQKGLGNKHGSAGLNNSIPSKTKTFEQTQTNGSTTNTTIQSPRGLELDSQKNKAKEIRNKFIAIDTWPLDWQKDPNKPGELLPQEPNSQQPLQTDEPNSAGFMTPQSFLKEQFRSTNELYKGWAKSLEKQEMNTNEYNKRLYSLQKEYDDKIRNIFQRKQELDMTEKLIKSGSIPLAKGYEMMWKRVLPPEAFAAMLPKIKSQGSKQYSLPVTPCVVTGIIHSKTKPMAIIDGNVIGEGQTIRGVRIVKVQEESVEFENAGKTWSQRVNDPPSTNWP